MTQHLINSFVNSLITEIIEHRLDVVLICPTIYVTPLTIHSDKGILIVDGRTTARPNYASMTDATTQPITVILNLVDICNDLNLVPIRVLRNLAERIPCALTADNTALYGHYPANMLTLAFIQQLVPP